MKLSTQPIASQELYDYYKNTYDYVNLSTKKEIKELIDKGLDWNIPYPYIIATRKKLKEYYENK